ncbi:PQQ-dependent dehydrogenase, methanol/ethanol family [Spongiibacter sp. IMCC21906]|uniref:PQQ-dependent dehydrogenase, methanol/ethanol family n=1 Tax=Spongiibacter sp. IMCC21906 TaxID=1620392 RepID=UPI00062DEB6C|nr:PQQ-dependent dehydrogenase, methanol/ethanol family [Spongiibacter sp. IMCC21906]AKH70336.1 PQQ-dependent dehydrogenase, methanol/ethanol family [Spongiibacter sp. IMCC21906]
MSLQITSRLAGLTSTLIKKSLLTALFAGSLIAATTSVADESDTANVKTRLAQADNEPQNWLSHGRNYSETRYSPLKQINTETINDLGLAWSYDLDTSRGQESTPLAIDGVLYTTSAWSKVQAFNATTGELLWQYDPEVPGEAAAKGCCDVVNRGAAYWDGHIYVGAFDGRLIALDAKTGEQLWSTMTVDPDLNYTITGAPRVVKGNVIIGNGGAEFGVRGYISAYDAKTGEQVWRFYTVPGKPGVKDNAASDPILEKLAQATWSGKWWSKEGGYGGGTVWDSMAYDAELDLLYVGVGNGSFWNRAIRSPGGGDNLFISSILALKPDTGEYVWHFQQVPGEEWDYTATQHMILTDLKIKGQVRQVLMQAPKNGFFYVLDRKTGEFISAEPYTPLNWATGVDPKTGRPNIKPQARYSKTGKPWLALPSSLGGHNWQPMAYNPVTQLVYIPTLEVPGLYKTDPEFKPMAKGMNLSIDLAPFTPPTDKKDIAKIKKSLKGRLIAWNPVTQKEVWRVTHSGPWNGGVLATAGGLVFQGDGDGFLSAYHATTGQKLWTFDAQSSIQAPPISYAVNGRQYISIVVGYGGSMPMNAGELLANSTYPKSNKSRVLTFQIGASNQLPEKVPVVKPKLTPPAQVGDADAIARGKRYYHAVCTFCHGGGAAGSGLLQDLRYSGFLASKEAWKEVVYNGVLSSIGMVSFKENFTADQVEDIRAYVIHRAIHEAQYQETTQEIK